MSSWNIDSASVARNHASAVPLDIIRARTGQSKPMTAKRRGRSRKSGEKVRVAFRRNRAKPARDKDWTRRQRHDAEATDDVPLTESVIAKGKLSRKRTVIEGADASGAESHATGIVVAMRGLIAEVDDGRRLWPCTVRRILRTRRTDERHPVTVGDRVRFTIEAHRQGVQSEGVIEAVEPRRGFLTRIVGKRRHTVVANVDQAVIVTSAAEPPCKPHLIDRYIVAAHAGGIEPIVCLNKTDLDEEGRIRDGLTLYQSLGYRTLATSAKTGDGVGQLQAVLMGKCSAIAGQSGVGKSSLLNAVDPRLDLRVGKVSAETFKGRHITTTATLIKLDFGGYVVDTPGVRSFDVSAVPLNEIEMHFVEFAEYIPHCKFPDCTHTHEADCSVKNALDDGKITPERYESYCRMFEERFGDSP